MPLALGLLVGAIVGSTDAAAVFALLKSAGLRVSERLSSTLEIESGLNDPMAVFLVLTLSMALSSPDGLGAGAVALMLMQQALVGAAMGLAGARRSSPCCCSGCRWAAQPTA